MPNNIPDCKKQELSRFDSMSDEELRAFLRLDASKPEGEASDIDEVLYVMELLSVRRKERGESRDPYKAFEEFKEYYAPENSFPKESGNTLKVLSPWRRVAVIAAVLIFLIGATATVGASQFDLFEIIAKWTKETFYSGEAGIEVQMDAEPSNIGSIPYSELQALLYDHGITACIVPTWIPDGFEQLETLAFELPQGIMYRVYHQYGEKAISFQIKECQSEVPLQIERSSSLLEVYSQSEIDYFILNNNGQIQVEWINKNFECVMYGDISLSEAKQMIDSIEKD